VRLPSDLTASSPGKKKAASRFPGSGFQ